MTSGTLHAGIITVAELLQDGMLSLPIYQRPYKWQPQHVEQLFDDLARHRGKPAYRLGTLVLHQHGGAGREKRDIVDGQQRTLTLLLIVHALMDLIDRREKSVSTEALVELALIRQMMIKPRFSSAISQHNLRQNYQVIHRRVARPDFDEVAVDFLLRRCELVRVTLNDISEAFQFFDAQNARGRDLAPHDLLKAYHLREFGGDEALKQGTVSAWENSDSRELETLFGQYLFRIRRWVKGDSARSFSKNDVALFKGVNLADGDGYPGLRVIRLAHESVDAGRMPAFPFQLDQPVLNGRRFFEMIHHYQKSGLACANRTWAEDWLPVERLDGFAPRILQALSRYEGRKRTGDGYVRMMFDCLLLYYVDRFGSTELSRAIEKIFIWAYSLRLSMQVVQLASMDNHVLGNNLFRVLREATHPQEFLQHPLPTVEQENSTQTVELAQLFREMRYMEPENGVTG